MLARVVLLASVGLVFLSSAYACGTDPAGVDACRQIEKARCESAQACGINLGTPVHSGDTPAENVAACTRYYDDQCLHGLSSGAQPGQPKVDACVNAILQGDCNTVRAPETSAACAFLVTISSTTTTDAAADASDAN